MAAPRTSNVFFANSIPHSMEKDLPDGGRWIVQKFGGTSIGKLASNVCDIVEYVF
jgi:aspartate kinase